MSDDLHWLAESGQLEELSDRLAAGADPDEFDEEGRAPLHIAAERSDSAILTALIDAGADVEAAERPLPHWRALHRACLPSPVRELGDAATVRLLLARGADANAVSSRGLAALHLSVSWADGELVQDLLDAGARADLADGNGFTPLHFACRRGATSLTESLVGDDGELGTPGLAMRSEAAIDRIEDRPVLEALLDAGADPEAEDRQGQTPLHVAAERGATWAVQALIELPVAVSPPDEYRATPLHRAANLAVADLLLNAGAELDALDRDASTPLHRAIGAGRMEVAELLLERGAHPGTRNREGQTPLHLAAGAGRGRTVERLLEAGADPSVKDALERTPYDDALQAGHEHVAQMLRRRRGWRRFFGG